MKSFITINGNQYPQPFRGLNGEVELQIATIVDSARNANGVVVGQKVGRDIQKVNQLRWAYLKAETWAAILQEWDTNFFSTVTYPDMVHNTWTTRVMYCGDRSAKPYRLRADGLPLDYVDCRVNVIDVGDLSSLNTDTSTPAGNTYTGNTGNNTSGGSGSGSSSGTGGGGGGTNVNETQ